MKKNTININISYPWSIHIMPPFKKYNYKYLKQTEKLSKEIFSLPMYKALEDKQIIKTTQIIKKYC